MGDADALLREGMRLIDVGEMGPPTKDGKQLVTTDFCAWCFNVLAHLKQAGDAL